MEPGLRRLRCLAPCGEMFPVHCTVLPPLGLPQDIGCLGVDYPRHYGLMRPRGFQLLAAVYGIIISGNRKKAPPSPTRCTDLLLVSSKTFSRCSTPHM